MVGETKRMTIQIFVCLLEYDASEDRYPRKGKKDQEPLNWNSSSP